MKETTAERRLKKKLVLNKETIRVLTDREMMDVQGATCGSPRSTCLDQASYNGRVTCDCH
jgi:hypothetical protein